MMYTLNTWAACLPDKQNLCVFLGKPFLFKKTCSYRLTIQFFAAETQHVVNLFTQHKTARVSVQRKLRRKFKAS